MRNCQLWMRVVSWFSVRSDSSYFHLRSYFRFLSLVNTLQLFNLMINLLPRISLKCIHVKFMMTISLHSLLHSTLHSIIDLRHVDLRALLFSYRLFNGVGMKAWHSSIADFICLATTSNRTGSFFLNLFYIGLSSLEWFKKSLRVQWLSD